MRRRPAKRRLKSITRVAIKLATPDSWQTIPMKRQSAEDVRLKRIKTRRKQPNSAKLGTRPTMGYMIKPMTSGGRTRRGIISKITYGLKQAT